MERGLRRFNYEVTRAKNGQEAVEAAIADPPDLIMMDLMLPVLDGFEAGRLIRKHPGTKSVPLIALTAQFGPENRNKCLAAGFDDLILKPFPLRDLQAIVEKVLKRQRR